MCISFEPVFVVGFKPVDFAVFEDKESNCTVNFVVVFEAVYFVVFVKAFFEFRFKFVVWLVADTENVEAVVFKLTAELPVVCWEVRGDKDKVFHYVPLFVVCGFSALCFVFLLLFFILSVGAFFPPLFVWVFAFIYFVCHSEQSEESLCQKRASYNHKFNQTERCFTFVQHDGRLLAAVLDKWLFYCIKPCL